MRQSLRKRSRRYKAQRQNEFGNYQRLLARMKAKIDRGVYSDSLTPPEVKKVKTLLSNAILDEWAPIMLRLGMKIQVRPCTLETSRRAYHAICCILRVAGNRTKVQKPDIQIRRRSIG